MITYLRRKNTKIFQAGILTSDTALTSPVRKRAGLF
jgi:hypothetical protein